MHSRAKFMLFCEFLLEHATFFLYNTSPTKWRNKNRHMQPDLMSASYEQQSSIDNKILSTATTHYRRGTEGTGQYLSSKVVQVQMDGPGENRCNRIEWKENSRTSSWERIEAASCGNHSSPCFLIFPKVIIYFSTVIRAQSTVLWFKIKSNVTYLPSFMSWINFFSASDRSPNLGAILEGLMIFSKQNRRQKTQKQKTNVAYVIK